MKRYRYGCASGCLMYFIIAAVIVFIYMILNAITGGSIHNMFRDIWEWFLNFLGTVH